MAEEIMTNEVENNEVDYIAAINDLKANSVSKDKYEKLQKENKQLLDTLISGGQLAPEDKPEEVDVNKLRDDLFNTRQQTNLAYVEKALKLRNALIEKGERDPFLPVGTHAQITEADAAKAQQVADVFQQCVDYAEGDPEIFTNELMRLTNETSLGRRKK